MTVASLRWTAHGAVAAPETLQLRLEPDHPGRVRFGAPVPSRALSDAEALANAGAFLDPGPRGRPVLSALLSGIDAARQERLDDLVAGLAALGVARITAHLAPMLARLVPGATTVAPVRTEADVRALPVGVAAAIPLESGTLPGLAQLVSELGAGRRTTLVWPFPGGSQAPSLDRVLAALRDAAPALRDVDWGIKGLPACALVGVTDAVPDALDRTWRSPNRWYVDADHQLADALLVRPDLIVLDKQESCRFCARFHACDGVASAWLRLGLAGELVPLEEVA